MSVYLALCMYVCMRSYSWANGVCLIDFREYVHILYGFYYSTRIFSSALSVVHVKVTVYNNFTM